MPSRSLTVTLPEPLLERIRGRARRAKRTVEAEVVELLSTAVAAGGNGSANGTGAKKSRPARVRDADPAEETLAPDIEDAIAKVQALDDRTLRKAFRPLITRKQSDRLAELNYKAQDEGLTKAEIAEQEELLHISEKSMVVCAAVLAELKKRGYDVSKYVGQENVRP